MLKHVLTRAQTLLTFSCHPLAVRKKIICSSQTSSHLPRVSVYVWGDLHLFVYLYTVHLSSLFMPECMTGVFCDMFLFLCVLCVCSLWFVLLATRGPSWHSDSSSQSDRGALPSNNRGFVALLLLACYGLPSLFLSLSLSFAFAPFFIEPIFLSEVLIWGAGQWGEGREARGPREGRTGEREERRCRMAMAADGRPFVPPFPGSSLEPPRLQLRWILPEREKERERDEGGWEGKRGHNDRSNWNLPILQNKCTHTRKEMWWSKETSK